MAFSLAGWCSTCGKYPLISVRGVRFCRVCDLIDEDTVLNGFRPSGFPVCGVESFMGCVHNPQPKEGKNG